MGLKSFLFGLTKTQSLRIGQKMGQKYLDTKCSHQAPSISNSLQCYMLPLFPFLGFLFPFLFIYLYLFFLT